MGIGLRALMTAMRLTKYHGLGNDFLVLLDGDLVDGARARALCERRTGIGADGLIQAQRGDGGEVRMHLWNADGSRAEMSGNGIRCLAEAVRAAGWINGQQSLTIATDDGARTVRFLDDGQSAVDMGVVHPLPDGRLSLGNPHEVRFVESLGDASDPAVPDVNVELVTPGPEPDAITMRVWERGVGETLACGTGACAAAYAARDRGLVGDRVRVHQLGGTAVVELGADGRATLIGPVVHVAEIEVGP
jgi:diaminopimelate epimerase